MSLIVARKYNNNLIIVSDTKLTYTDEEKNSPRDGTIKTIILSPNIAVCYAGETKFAEEALEEIADNLQVESIKSVLLQHHIQSTQEIDFILAVNLDGLTLFEIKNGNMTETENSWIGSHQGFTKFQTSFHSVPDDKDVDNGITTLSMFQLPKIEDDDFRSMYIKMYEAMIDVIEDVEVNEVGGFLIPIIFENEGFCYPVYVRLFRKPIDLDTEVTAHRSKISFGTVEDGAFVINFSGGKADQLAIHFTQGNVGVVYSRDNFGFMNPVIYSDMDEIDFAKFLIENSNVKLGFSMRHGASDYAIKAQKELGENRYENAQTRIIQAINQSSQFWGPEPDKNTKYSSLQECIDERGKIEIPNDQIANLEGMFNLKGRIYFELDQFQDAILAFREAITLNKTSYFGLYGKSISQASNGDHKGAIKTLSECLSSHNIAEPYYLRGLLYSQMKQYSPAQLDFEKALTIDKNHVASKNELQKIKHLEDQ